MLQLRTVTLQVAEIYRHVGSAKPGADCAIFLQIQAAMITFTDIIMLSEEEGSCADSCPGVLAILAAEY